MGMTITWLGHSCFRVECGDYAVVLDPYEPGSVPGCGDVRETADQVLCSHEHHDHNYRGGVTLTGRGEGPIQVTALPWYHDDCEGEKRGPSIIHVLEGGGVRIAHFGDVGCMPSPALLEQLQGLDAALLPVGGFYTVGPQEAKAIVDAIQPRVVVPMHYRSQSFGFDVIGPVEDFLALCQNVKQYGCPTLEITPQMEEQVAVLFPKLAK